MLISLSSSLMHALKISSFVKSKISNLISKIDIGSENQLIERVARENDEYSTDRVF